MFGASRKENMIKLVKHSGSAYLPYELDCVTAFTHKDALFYQRNGIPGLKEWTDAWGVGFKITDEKFDESGGYPVSHPIKDLDEIKDYRFPDPHDPSLMESIKEEVKKVDRENMLVMVKNPGFMFVRSWLMCGMEDLLSATMLEPLKVEQLLDRIEEYQSVIARRYIKEISPDIAHVGDDAGTTKALIMRPEQWRKLVKPRLKRIFDIYKEAGCTILFHCCGCVMEIIDDIIEIGVDILNPLQFGANDISYIKSRTSGKMTIYGGIDAHTVATAEPDKVKELAKRTIKILAEGGGYIAAADQELPFPRANIEAIKSAVEEYNRERGP